MGNGKLFLGLGVGVVVGAVLGYLSNSSKGRKMRKDMCCAAHEIEEDAYQLVSAVKQKAEKVGTKLMHKAPEKVEITKE